MLYFEGILLNNEGMLILLTVKDTALFIVLKGPTYFVVHNSKMYHIRVSKLIIFLRTVKAT